MPAKKKAKVSKAKPVKAISSSVTAPVMLNSVISNFKSHKKVWIISAVAVVILLVGILPHLIVAVVDKSPISAFDYYRALDQKYGKDLKEQLISEKLVADEASSRGVKVTDSDINTEISKYQAQASGSANFNQILTQQGLTLDEFKSQLKLQIEVQKMFGDNMSVSDDEINQYIQQNQSQLPTPITDAVKSQIKDQIKQQKTASAFQSWLQSAQQSNRVTRF